MEEFLKETDCTCIYLSSFRLAEMNIALKDVEIDSTDFIKHQSACNFGEDDADLYTLAKTYFDLKELDR